MSQLPIVDSLKVSNRELERVRQLYMEALHREAQLEVLAEALRDERDDAVRERDDAQRQLALKNDTGSDNADKTEEPVIGKVLD